MNRSRIYFFFNKISYIEVHTTELPPPTTSYKIGSTLGCFVRASTHGSTPTWKVREEQNAFIKTISEEPGLELLKDSYTNAERKYRGPQ